MNALYVTYDTDFTWYSVIFCVYRDIKVNLRRSLVSVDHTKKLATFDLLDSETGEQETFNVWS